MTGSRMMTDNDDEEEEEKDSMRWRRIHIEVFLRRGLGGARVVASREESGLGELELPTYLFYRWRHIFHLSLV
jgi:hypothetical protein